MGFSYITGKTVKYEIKDTSLSLAETMNVAAGDLLVGWCSWEGQSATASISDGGSNVFTMESVYTDTYNYGCFGYKISASANATAMFTVTYNPGVEYKTFMVMQFRPDTGDTVSRDAANTANGVSAYPQSGNITTTGSDEVVIGASKYFNYATGDGEQIGDADADAVLTISELWISHAWYKLLTAGASNIHAQCQLSSSLEWICNIIAFKAAGSSGVSIPVLMSSSRRRKF